METRKRSKKVLTVQQRVDIIREVERGERLCVVARKRGLSPSTLSGIVAKKAKFLQQWEEGQFDKKSAKQSAVAEVDAALAAWFAEKRANGVRVSDKILGSMAVEFAAAMSITQFKGSSGYVQRFKKRYGIVGKKVPVVPKSASPRISDDWVKRVLPQLKSGYKPEDVFHVGETALFYRALPNMTPAFKEQELGGGKLSKERVTLLLIANETGDERLKPVLIGKTAKPQSCKSVDMGSLPVTYCWSQKACMTKQVWLWILSKLNAKMAAQKRHILLVVDNSSTHFVGGKQTFTNIRLAYLPSNATNLIQPLEQGVINALKVRYRTALLKRLLVHLDLHKPVADFAFSLLDCCELVGRVWRSIPDALIRNCFNKAWLLHRDLGVKLEAGSEKAREELELADVFEMTRNRLSVSDSVKFNDYVAVDDAAFADEPFNDVDIIGITENDATTPDVFDTEEDEEKEPVGKPCSVIEALELVGELKRFCQHAGAVSHIYDLEDELLSLRFSGSAKQQEITTYFRPKDSTWNAPCRSADRASTSTEISDDCTEDCEASDSACDAARFYCV